MKSLVSGLFLFFGLGSFAQQQQQLKTNLYNQKTAEGYNVLADNDEFCPVSMKIDFELDNMSSTNGNHKIFVVPAKTKGFVISTIKTVKPNAGGGFKTHSQSNYGDATARDLKEFVYSLPFKTGESFTVHQGYNGTFSHQNENAIDFDMPIGTEVYATRDGVVVKVVENNDRACPERSCTQFNNYIIVYHNDGTFASYVHLNKDGSLVNEGDTVKENQLIGYSGFTGFASGPHLHFMVFVQRIDSRDTVRTKFKTNGGKDVEILKEKFTYTK